MTDHPITPPPELVEQRWNKPQVGGDFAQEFAAFFARWGADQELEACCHLLRLQGFDVVDDLRAARRPKPPSLKEQALAALKSAPSPSWPNQMRMLTPQQHDLIRLVLEALPE